MKTITSRHNPLLKRIREAIREHTDEIAIEGPKPVADALASGWNAIAVVTRASAVSSAAEAAAAPLVVALADDVFDTLTETRNPQGVIGLFERPRARAADILSRRDTIAVALDGVQDPGNVGTIVRLAAAFDAAGVLLLPGSADAYGPKAIRASAGAILTVPVARATLAELLDANVPLVATAIDGTPNDPPARDAVLVFGNEGAGVSGAVLQHAKRLAIAMSGRVESLNVASSAAILLARSYSLRH
jgi:TrmH family RNA methyltransferase